MKAGYIIAGVGVLGAGALLYMWQQNKNVQLPAALNPYAGPNLVAQPSNTYPYQVAVPPRVDNSNQPWYGGDRAPAVGAVSSVASQLDMNFAQNVAYAKGFADITASVGDIWGNLSDLFGSSSDPAPSNIQAGTDSFSWGSLFS